MVLLYLYYKLKEIEGFEFQNSDLRLGMEYQIYLSLREALQFFAFTLLTLHFILGECERDSTT